MHANTSSLSLSLSFFLSLHWLTYSWVCHSPTDLSLSLSFCLSVFLFLILWHWSFSWKRRARGELHWDRIAMNYIEWRSVLNDNSLYKRISSAAQVNTVLVHQEDLLCFSSYAIGNFQMLLQSNKLLPAGDNVPSSPLPFSLSSPHCVIHLNMLSLMPVAVALATPREAVSSTQVHREPLTRREKKKEEKRHRCGGEIEWAHLSASCMQCEHKHNPSFSCRPLHFFRSLTFCHWRPRDVKSFKWSLSIQFWLLVYFPLSLSLACPLIWFSSRSLSPLFRSCLFVTQVIEVAVADLTKTVGSMSAGVWRRREERGMQM